MSESLPAAGRILKLAMYGRPGAGKSTSSVLLRALCEARGIDLRVIRLAVPIYECQSAVYRAAGVSLMRDDQQDGELLNFLGGYLRKINPNALTDRFAHSLSHTFLDLEHSPAGLAIVLCDDMRRLDAGFMKALGFSFVRIEALAETCVSRRQTRGDRTLGSAEHETERGSDEVVPDWIVENNGTLDDLQRSLEAAMLRIIA